MHGMADADDKPDTPIPFPLSLRGKFIGLLALLVALTAVALTSVDYGYVRQLLSSSVQEQLQLRAEGQREVLLGHVRQRHEGIRLVASRTRLREILGLRLDGAIDEQRFRAESQRILLDAQESTEGFLNISVTDPDGRVVAATSVTYLGADLSDSRAFAAGAVEPTLSVPTPAASGYRAMLTGPVISNAERFLGVVVVEVDAQPELDILSAVPSGFESAEVRLGAWETASTDNRRIRYLFPVGPAQALSIDASFDPVMGAALNGDSGFAETIDYLGRDVLSVHQPVGYSDWAMVAQVNADEAYAPIAEVRNVLLLVAFGFFVLAAVIGARIAASFTRPVLKLAKVARAVEGGDLAVRARIRTRDELGLLGQAFNTMTSSLARHQNHLEELVRERTAQLQESRDQFAELCRVLEGQAEIMDRDLKRAEVIQRSLLPGVPPELPGYCVHTLYRPGRNVGGDLFDVVRIDDRYIVLVVADASGHGVSAAMLSVLFKHRLQVIDETTGEPLRPANALAAVNQALIAGSLTPGMFVTCVYCLVDVERQQAVLASAGHTPALWLKRYGVTEELEHTGPGLGLYKGALYAEVTIDLTEHDQLLFYTDGIFDIGGDDPPNVASIAQELVSDGHGQDVLDRLFLNLSHGHEREDRDDVTMLLLDVHPGESYFGMSSSVPELEIDPDTEAPLITYALTPQQMFICLQGRVTWTYGEALFEGGQRAIQQQQELVIDLSACEYLDSTLLGTLHELMQQADAGLVTARVQGASLALVDAFRELSMESVLNHLHTESVPIPENRSPLELPEADARGQKLRLLKAHEVLASLSRDNEEEFGTVVEAMREDVDAHVG